MDKRYNTGNSRPSNSMKDLNDNALAYDDFLNSESDTFIDRFGNAKDTMIGATKKMAAATDAVIDEARQNLIPLSKQYMTLADAQADIANIPEGSTTYYRSPDDSALAVEVMNVGGTLQPTGRKMASADAIYKYLNQNSVSSASIPLFVDSNGSVPIWLSGGKLDAAGLGESLLSEVRKTPNNYTPVSSMYSGAAFPLVYDSEGSVAVWISNGKLDAAGLGPAVQETIKKLITGSIIKPKVFSQEGYGFKLKQKITQKEMGGQVSINIAFTGDSWAEMTAIPQSFINSLGGSYKDAGWIPASTRTDNVMSGISISASGMASYDADNEHSTGAPLYGCGPDGNALYTVSSSGSVTFKNIPATDIDIYYYDGDGVLTIDIDGNKTIVTGGNTGAAIKFSINNLASGTVHTVILTTSSVGVCSVLGMYARNKSITSGFSVSRMGNGGAIGKDFEKFGDNWIYPIAKDFDLDLVIIILGTNDFRKSKGIDDYKSGLNLLISKYKLASPGCAICLVSPAQSNGTGDPVLSKYDEAMQLVATENNVSFFSGYNLFPSSWDNGISGMWYNGLHLGALGARILSESLAKNLGLK